MNVTLGEDWNYDGVSGDRPDLTGPINYVVVAGDSLYKLQYEFGVNYERIKQLNNLKSDTIYIGQTLIIAP